MRNILFDVLEINIVIALLILILYFCVKKFREKYGAFWLKMIWLVLVFRLLIPYNFSLPNTDFRLFNVPGFEQEMNLSEADNVIPGYESTMVDSEDIIAEDIPMNGSEGMINGIGSELGTGIQGSALSESDKMFAAEDATVLNSTVDESAEALINIEATEKKRYHFTDILLYIWLIGMGLSAGYYIFVYVYVQCKILRNIVPVKNHILNQKLFLLQEKYLGKEKLAVYESDSVQTPVFTGIFQPRLIIPSDKKDWSEKELELVIAHELCHYRNKDLFVKILMLLACCINWFNPGVYWVKWQLYYDMELICDSYAMQGRDDEERELYARVLMDFASKSKGNSAFITGLSGGSKRMKSRIHHIWDDGKKKKGVVVFTCMIVACLGIGLFVSCGYKPVENEAAELHSFKQEEVACVPEIKIYSFENAEELGKSWEICGFASGESATWHIIEIEGVEYFYVEHVRNGQMVTELYNYAILGEQYSLANGIRVGDPVEEIFIRYPNMAKIYFQDDYSTLPKGCLGWSGVTYPHSIIGWDENYEYIDGDYNWTNQFDYAIVGNVVRENDIEAPLYVALLIKDEFVDAITFYSPTDGPGIFEYEADVAGATDEKGNSLLYTAQYELVSGKLCQIKLYGKMLNEYNYGISYVEITSEDGKDYSFFTQEGMSEYWEQPTEYTECWEKDGGIHVADINFDGYADIGLMAQIPAYNLPYIYYIFDSENGKYEYYGSFMCFLHVDTETETCLEQYRAGQTYYDDVWAKDNAGGLYLMQRTITEYDYATGESTETTEYYSLEEASKPVYDESYLTQVEDPVYRDLITEMLDTGKFPAGGSEWYGNPYDNYYAIADVDMDGQDELIIYFPNGFAMAAMVYYVYDYDRTTGEPYIQCSGFPDFTIYDNGYMIEMASHNHGRSNLDDFWPYSVLKYNEQTDTYECIAHMDAWQQEYNSGNLEFPEEKDADGDGVVYYNWTAEEWDNPSLVMDNAEYEMWYQEITEGDVIQITRYPIISEEEYYELYPQPEANG